MLKSFISLLVNN